VGWLQFNAKHRQKDKQCKTFNSLGCTSHITCHMPHVISHASRTSCWVTHPRLREEEQGDGQFPPCDVTRHTSHVTRHTSHVTRHTSHVTRHSSHVTRHTSHVTRHTSHVARHTSPQQFDVSAHGLEVACVGGFVDDACGGGEEEDEDDEKVEEEVVVVVWLWWLWWLWWCCGTRVKRWGVLCLKEEMQHHRVKRNAPA